MTYEIIVAGVVHTITGTREEAEKVLNEARASALEWVHAPETFQIREKNMAYEIIVAGVVHALAGTRKAAEKTLDEMRTSALEWINASETFQIRKV